MFYEEKKFGQIYSGLFLMFGVANNCYIWFYTLCLLRGDQDRQFLKILQKVTEANKKTSQVLNACYNN